MTASRSGAATVAIEHQSVTRIRMPQHLGGGLLAIEVRKVGNKAPFEWRRWKAREMNGDAAWHYASTRKGVVRNVRNQHARFAKLAMRGKLVSQNEVASREHAQ